MKQLKLVFAVLALVLLSACESSQNYSKLLEQEQLKFEQFMERNNYSVITEFPSDSVLIIGQWYRFDSEDIYICIDSLGLGRKVVTGDELSVRYIQSTLDEFPLVVSYWTTQDKPYPDQIIKGSLVKSCEGWDNAFGLMRYSGTIAQVIVPSKLGFSAAASSVTPFHYKLSMKVTPK